MPSLQPPGEAALAAAYQVTARAFANEEQLIWRRTALFVTLNGLVVAGVQFIPKLHPAFYIVIPFVGVIYSVCWHFSMNRAWAYQGFHIRMMREQEAALKLGDLGTFTRGKRIVDGGPGDLVGGEQTSFPPKVVLFKAKVLADSTTWLFAILYAAFLLNGIFQLRLA